MNKVIEFIQRRFPNDSNWTSGNCYYFALILKDRFGGEIFYDLIEGHFFVKIKKKYYDYAGEIDVNNRVFISWEKFDKYDKLQKKRIIHDCLK